MLVFFILEINVWFILEGLLILDPVFGHTRGPSYTVYVMEAVASRHDMGHIDMCL